MDLRPVTPRAALALALALAPSPTVLHAQTPPAPSPAPEEPAGEATVRARTPSHESYHQDLTAEDIRRMPGTRGDPLLAVQNLPGVGRPPFGLGAFIVRGSDPQDTLVTLEGQPFGLPFHFYGLASTVATEMVDRVEYLPGNFSARWGRASGGVVDVTLRAPARDRVHVAADADALDAGAYASAPLGRNASVALGARRSYLDALLGLFAPPDSGGYSQYPRYWDYQATVDADLGPRDSVRVTATGSDDSTALHLGTPDPNDPTLRGDFGTHVSFYGVQARWRHRLAPGVTHTFAPAVSASSQDVALGPEVRYALTTYTLALRDELDARISPRVRVSAGVDLQAGRNDDAVTAPPLSTNGITDPTLPGHLVQYAAAREFINPAVWAETELTPTACIQLRAGVRGDWYSVTDALTLDPRASLRVALDPRLALRAGVGRYSTPARGYQTLPGFGNPDLGPEHWTHLTAGVQSDLVPGVLEASADVFVKLGDDTVAPSSRAVTRDGVSQPERFANTGSARVIGGEWFLRLRPGRIPLLAMLSYTYQRAERRDAPGAAWYLSPWDQTHLLTAVVGVVLPHGWEAGVRARYASGAVDPRVTGALYDADHDVAQTFVDPLHPGRLPDYFALDVRVAKSFRAGPLRMQVVAEVLNATYHQNVESRIYSYDRRTSAYVTGLPLVPNLGLRAEY